MKRKIFAVFLVLIFIFTSTIGISAKGFRSSGSRSSFSKSFGSSKSKSSFSSSKSKSTKSTTRSLPGTSSSTKSSSSSKSSNTSGFKSSTSKKTSYMSDTYKSQISSKNYNKYKQTLNNEQQKVYTDSMKRDYTTSSRRMNFENAMNTRATRINSFSAKRPIFINVNTGMFGNPFSYGYAYVGPWDLWFLTRASEMFWYHHWLEIMPYRSYFNEQEFNKLEARVNELEKQGIQRDTNYLDPDVDPDLQLSEQYQEENVDKVYYTDKESGPGVGTVVVVTVVIGVVAFIAFRKLSKPKKKKSHYSSIY